MILYLYLLKIIIELFVILINRFTKLYIYLYILTMDSQAFVINPPLSDHSSCNESTHASSICSKGPSHSSIQYFCLESTCSNDRLLCRACIAASHRKHKVGIIDKLIEPLNRLNMNSFHTDSR